MTTLAVAALAVYGALSAVTWLAYAVDKRAARRERPRTPEAVLHLLELAGGWPGGLLAQRMLRHKNAKAGYQIVFWLIVALHLAGWCALAWFWNASPRP